MIDVAENAEKALRFIRESKYISFDTEGTGLDWKVNQPVGYVIGAPQPDGTIREEDVVYVPIRHGGGGNLMGGVPMTSPTDSTNQHLWEAAAAKAFDDRNRANTFGRIVGHHTKFDVHMAANQGIMLGRRLACTQNQAAMIDEYQRSFSLDACALKHSVTTKKGEIMYAHLHQLFGGKSDKKSMENFWRTAGNDPVAVEYSCGDGVTTWELFVAQERVIDEEDMRLIADIENDLIWTIFRMERKGIAVDPQRINELRMATENYITELLQAFPAGFNVRSPLMIRKAFEDAGITNWPTTEKGAPSFTEKWLVKSEIGRAIVEVRQQSNLINSFVEPLEKRHMFKGRVHATLNQLKSDDKGTISGRFSCSDPNLQQVPKRNKSVAKPFRRLFVADPGHIFWERDYSQCFAAGTRVSVPGGTKNIEDMAPGDLVYSYDENRNLVLRPVTWSGQTGVREIVRVHWKTNGRTTGHFDCTLDHRIRQTNGEYVTAGELLLKRGQNPKGNNPLWVPVLALRHEIKTERNGYQSLWIHATGVKRQKEARFVFAQVEGWHPEEVHHKDGDSLNNTPKNLEGVSGAEHRSMHMAYGMERLTREQRVERSRRATEGLKRKMAANGGMRGNHAIVDVEILPGEAVPVYDITVDDTHNFIANEVCVHNCEPRLFAHYSQDENLMRGYNAKPFVDAHQVVADMLQVERDPTAKRMNMGIFTGMQARSFADHMGWPLDQATSAFNKWMAAFPAIPAFQNKAKARLLNRGYVHTVLGRRCRLEDRRFAYRGTSKIIQGSNADILKYKLLEADIACEQNGDIVQVLMTVHDSFNGQYQDTPEALALFKDITAQMREVQADPFNLSVPFEMDGHEGRDWCEATWGP